MGASESTPSASNAAVEGASLYETLAEEAAEEAQEAARSAERVLDNAVDASETTPKISTRTRNIIIGVVVAAIVVVVAVVLAVTLTSGGDDDDECPECGPFGACDPDKKTCTCFNGYSGTTCEEPPGCPNDCMPNGTCNEERTQCICAPGFDLDPEGGCSIANCGGGPCVNGTCNPDGTRCNCDDVPYHGDFCEIPDNCATSADCLNGGTCVDGKCDCRDGFSGATCEEEPDTACLEAGPTWCFTNGRLGQNEGEVNPGCSDAPNGLVDTFENYCQSVQCPFGFEYDPEVPEENDRCVHPDLFEDAGTVSGRTSVALQVFNRTPRELDVNIVTTPPFAGFPKDALLCRNPQNPCLPRIVQPFSRNQLLVSVLQLRTPQIHLNVSIGPRGESNNRFRPVYAAVPNPSDVTDVRFEPITTPTYPEQSMQWKDAQGQPLVVRAHYEPVVQATGESPAQIRITVYAIEPYVPTL